MAAIVAAPTATIWPDAVTLDVLVALALPIWIRSPPAVKVEPAAIAAEAGWIRDAEAVKVDVAATVALPVRTRVPALVKLDVLLPAAVPCWTRSLSAANAELAATVAAASL